MPLRIRLQFGHPIPGGFHYPVKDGLTLKTEIDDPTEAINDLAQQVQAYRVNNGQPPGDPLPDIVAWYAQEYPWSVENTEVEYQQHDKTLEDCVMEWVNSVWRSPPKVLLEPDTSKKRADACINCPHKSMPSPILSPPAYSEASEDTDEPPLPLTGPQMAQKEANRRVYLLAHANPAPEEAGICSLHKWDNRLSCCLPDCKCPYWPTAAHEKP